MFILQQLRNIKSAYMRGEHCGPVAEGQNSERDARGLTSGKHACEMYTPLYPTFIVKLGFSGIYLFFLFLFQNIDCGYSLETPPRGSSNMYPTLYDLSKNKKNIKKILLKIFIFFST